MDEFLQTYHHPKNITFTKGGGGYQNPIHPPSSYATKHGPHRQSQVDTEIKRILKSGTPAKSKDQSKIHICVTEDRQFIFHHYHHKAIVLKMPPRNKSREKWQLVWWWREYEVATDERVMKAVMAGLQARFEESGGSGSFYFEGADASPSAESSIGQTSQQSALEKMMLKPSAESISQSSQQSALPMTMKQPSANEKRKRAAAAAEQRSTNKPNREDSRGKGMSSDTLCTTSDSVKKKPKPNSSEVIDLT